MKTMSATMFLMMFALPHCGPSEGPGPGTGSTPAPRATMTARMTSALEFLAVCPGDKGTGHFKVEHVVAGTDVEIPTVTVSYSVNGRPTRSFVATLVDDLRRLPVGTTEVMYKFTWTDAIETSKDACLLCAAPHPSVTGAVEVTHATGSLRLPVSAGFRSGCAGNLVG